MTQLEAVHRLLASGQALTSFELVAQARQQFGVYMTDASATARVRDLRKARNGMHCITCRYRPDGYYEYQLAAGPGQTAQVPAPVIPLPRPPAYAAPLPGDPRLGPPRTCPPGEFWAPLPGQLQRAAPQLTVISGGRGGRL
jgi:hypothetical protein